MYGIVRQNDGAIDLDSRVGHGTTVWIYLPRYLGPAVAVDTPVADDLARGTETILLVEDEPMMLDLSQTMLERLGYRVLTAAAPAVAMEMAARHGDAIDLLFTDIVMPAMSGTDLAARLVAARPGLKCLFASGHFTHARGGAAAITMDMHFLQKPFSMRELSIKVREALGDRP